MTALDQDRAARLVDVARWRAVYHHNTNNSGNRSETIAWFETTAEAAWAEAATQLPPAGYNRPAEVTVERGTFTVLPEGGHGWQTLGPIQTATVNHHGLALDTTDDDQPDPPPAAAAVAADQTALF